MRTRLILIAVTWAVVVGLVAGSAHAQAPTEPGGQFSLIGVVMLEDGRNLAFIQEPNLTKVRTVRLGDNVGPYRVTKILSHQVELTGPGGAVVIPLAGQPGAVAVASASGPTKPSEVGTPSQQAANSPAALGPNVTILPGDPRRNFPASQILVGTGTINVSAGQTPQALQAQALQAQALQAKAAQFQASQAQSASGPSAASSPSGSQPEVQLLRGDPRREFPASQMLIGAGARIGR